MSKEASDFEWQYQDGQRDRDCILNCSFGRFRYKILSAFLEDSYWSIRTLNYRIGIDFCILVR